MTRKHFEAIASTIATTTMSRAARKALANNMAETVGAFNPYFDKAKFLKACGV